MTATNNIIQLVFIAGRKGKVTKMTNKKTWNEFRDSGLLWWVNRILHTFGWAICVDPENNTAFPARVEFRGFVESCEDEGFKKIQQNFIKEEYRPKDMLSDEEK